MAVDVAKLFVSQAGIKLSLPIFMMASNTHLVLLLVASLSSVDAYKILLFAPQISDSNSLLHYRVAQLLADKGGHNVTVYRPIYDHDVKTGVARRGSSVEEIRFPAVADANKWRQFIKEQRSSAFKTTNPTSDLKFLEFFNVFNEGCEAQVSNKELLDKLRAKEFDLAIAIFYDLCPLGIIHALKIPSYVVMSNGLFVTNMAYIVGAPTVASYVPHFLSAKSDSMTFYERFENLLAVAITHPLCSYFMYTPQTKIFRRHFGEDFPSLVDLARDAALAFVNSEELLDFPRPILHKVVYIGGLEKKEAKPLDEEWTKITERATTAGKRGIVLFSLGTTWGEDMPAETRAAFAGAFKRFPQYLFVWKFGTDIPEVRGIENVVVKKWMPQTDLLGSGKVVAFITHGGYNSLLETAFAGVPIVGIPLAGDQMTNMRRVWRHGIGITVNKEQLTEEALAQAITEIVTNPSYRQASARLSAMLKKKPFSAEELLLRWVDFVAEFKTLPNLQPVGASMELIEYLSLDVIAVVALVLIAVFFIACKACAFCCRRCRKSHRISEKKRQ